jgi:ABC-type nitrate/sulfonate/bicarbonate transport system substrate-binding protein
MTGLDRRTLLGSATGALVASVTPMGAGAQGRTLTFVTPFGYIMAYADVLVAKEGGHFAKQGLNVTMQAGRGSAQAVQQILSGQAMFSRTGGVDLMKAIANEGAPIVSIAVITQGSPFFVVSKKGAGQINNPKDMVGKTIGVISKGGATENLLDIMLANAGVDPKSVPRETVGNAPGAFGLIEQNRIQAYIISIGSWIALKRQNAPMHSWNTDDHAPIPGQVYITSNDIAEKEQDTIVRFLKAVDAAMQDIHAPGGYDRALQLVKPYEIAEAKDADGAKQGLAEESQLWISAGEKNRLRHVPEAWVKGADQMLKAGVIKSAPVEKFYTNKFIDLARG